MNYQTVFLIVGGLIMCIFAISHSPYKPYDSWALNPFQYYFLIALSMAMMGGGIYLIIEYFSNKKKKREAMSKLSNIDTKQCPTCAEIIKFEAKICKHCSYKFSEEDILTQKAERERILQSEYDEYSLGKIDDYKLLQIAYDYQYNKYDYGRARYYLERIRKEFPQSEYLPIIEQRLREIGQ
jgi:hypothetical protein